MSGQVRPSSRNSKSDLKGAAGGGAGDMSARRKQGSRGESAVTTKQSGISGGGPAMEILEHGDADTHRSSSRISLGSRSRSNLGQAPPRSDSSLSQRVCTPSKHVALTAVKRKQESDYDRPIEPELDWREFTRSNSSLSRGVLSSNSLRTSETFEEETPNHEVEYSELACAKVESHILSEDRDGVTEMTVRMEAVEIKGSEGTSEKTEDKRDSSDDEGDEDSDEEPRKAPNELLMEFLDCIMKKDFKNAEKLCKMILIYEPNNQEALSFQPVIQEKLRLEQEAAEAGEDGSDDDDDEEDEDDDDDDDDDEDDSSLEDSSDDEDDDDDDDDNQAAAAVYDGELPPRPDSGIGM